MADQIQKIQPNEQLAEVQTTLDALDHAEGVNVGDKADAVFPTVLEPLANNVHPLPSPTVTESEATSNAIQPTGETLRQRASRNGVSEIIQASFDGGHPDFAGLLARNKQLLKTSPADSFEFAKCSGEGTMSEGAFAQNQFSGKGDPRAGTNNWKTPSPGETLH